MSRGVPVDPSSQAMMSGCRAGGLGSAARNHVVTVNGDVHFSGQTVTLCVKSYRWPPRTIKGHYCENDIIGHRSGRIAAKGARFPVWPRRSHGMAAIILPIRAVISALAAGNDGPESLF